MGVLHIVLISFDNLTGTEVVLLGKREAQLSSCYSQIALRVNLWWVGRIFSWLIPDVEGPPTVGGTTSVQVDLGAVRSKLS